jgi:hypothetical protein
VGYYAKLYWSTCAVLFRPDTGDIGYGITPATSEEIAYNKLHKKERKKKKKVIISCCVIHNVAKYLKNNLPNDDEVEDLLEENDEDNEEIEENQREDLRQRGQQFLEASS